MLKNGSVYSQLESSHQRKVLIYVCLYSLLNAFVTFVMLNWSENIDFWSCNRVRFQAYYIESIGTLRHQRKYFVSFSNINESLTLQPFICLKVCSCRRQLLVSPPLRQPSLNSVALLEMSGPFHLIHIRFSAAL